MNRLTEGVINKTALIAAKARMIDPNLARDIIIEQGPASQKLFNDVRSDVIAMSDGNEANYIDAAKDPTAQTRGQFLQKIISGNYKYLLRLDPKILQGMGLQQPPGAGQNIDPIFSALLAKYLKNLQLGVSQVQNRMVGRIGVSPGGMAGNGGMSPAGMGQMPGQGAQQGAY